MFQVRSVYSQQNLYCYGEGGVTKFLHFLREVFFQQSQLDANSRTKMALGGPGARAQARGGGSGV